MATREIKCLLCSINLGIIRDATLRVHTEHLCGDCTKQVKQDRSSVNEYNPFGMTNNPFDFTDKLFKDIFNKGE